MYVVVRNRYTGRLMVIKLIGRPFEHITALVREGWEVITPTPLVTLAEANVELRRQRKVDRDLAEAHRGPPLRPIMAYRRVRRRA